MDLLVHNMEKLIITVAPTGSFAAKKHNPNIPLQPEEIIEDVYACYRKGASIVHVHARDKQGKPTGYVEVYKEIVSGIKEKCPDIIIQLTTAPLQGSLTLKERSIPLNLMPEMASLDLGSFVNWDNEIVIRNSRKDIEYLCRAMWERNIKPELEVFSHSNIEEIYFLRDKNIIKPPFYVEFVMGFKASGGISAIPRNFFTLWQSLPPGSKFNLAAMGPAELHLTTLSMLCGGHVRVGMEDNIFYTKDVLAKSNAQLVERTVSMARELGREIASPDEARILLGLKENR